MNIQKIVVFGAGTMGHGIAEILALANYDVIIVDVDEKVLESALQKIEWSLKKLEKKGKIENYGDIISKIKTTTDINVVKDADYVIEAIVEKFEVKAELFRRIDEIAKPECIFATNTSTLPISELAKATKREDKFIGLHFFNPPTLMPLVEIIKSEKTSNETLEITKSFAKSIGKDFVIVEKDVPGFLVNRINLRVFIEAARLVELEGFDIEEVDATAKYRLGMPMGIFEVMDFSGIDVVYYASKAMKARGFIFVESKLIEEKFKAKELGMKVGKGFYDYPKAGYFRVKIRRNKAYKLSPVMLMAPAINEAAWLIRNGVASKEDIEKAMKLGMNYSIGLLEMADNFGIDRVVNALKEKKEKMGFDEYEPDKLLLKMVNEGNLGKKAYEIMPSLVGSEMCIRDRIINCEKPIVSIVNGLAFGGGMELNLLFDIVIASNDSTFAVPEVKIGALPPIASSIGVALYGKKFIEFILTGETLEAEEAKEFGIVNVVVDSEQLEDVAIEYAEKIALSAPRSISSIRKILAEIYATYNLPFKVAMREILLSTQLEDFKVGTGAFVKKKKSEWRGR